MIVLTFCVKYKENNKTPTGRGTDGRTNKMTVCVMILNILHRQLQRNPQGKGLVSGKVWNENPLETLIRQPCLEDIPTTVCADTLAVNATSVCLSGS